MTPSNDELSDFDKLFAAFSSISSISSIDDIFRLFGIHDLPQAQKFGIIVGISTFAITITTVFCLLVFGGSFQRIAEQTESASPSIPNSVEERIGRPMLLERLLEAQERMLKNYPKTLSEEMTNLTRMLLNIAPNVSKAQEVVNSLVSDDEGNKGGKEIIEKKKEKLNDLIPEGYEKNYIEAYRRCQDIPGGPILSGLPEARLEAFARSYAGCGIHTTTEYRRSYARMYEFMSCVSHLAEKKNREHWLSRPGDLVGRTVRLEPFEIDRHLQSFFNITCGDAYLENRKYDPNEVWAFQSEGPFQTVDEMGQSFVIKRNINEAAFAIVEHVTDKIIGMVCLTNDDPRNLSISLELPVVKPSSEGTVEPIEGCFLLLDRLFALGYRRVQLSVDSMDTKGKKLSGRLGFTQEGMIPKDRIVKESNRDSTIYGLLNSDWDKGARSFLFKKIHGEKAQKADLAYVRKEEELEMQKSSLEEKKAK